MAFEVNLHTHCRRCRHASGSVDDYCRSAIDHGIRILGFSDHGPFPDERYSEARMFYSELDDYVSEVRQAQIDHPELCILAGVEADFCPDLGRDFYLDTYFGRHRLDYLIAGCHAVEFEGETYAFWRRYSNQRVVPEFVKLTIAAIESGVFDCVVHPDGFACGIDHVADFKSAFRDIVQAAKACRVPLEINANGFRKGLIDTPEGRRYQYPVELFWEVAAEVGGIEVVAGSDAHTPETIVDRLDDCARLAEKYGLTLMTEKLARRLVERTGR